MPPHSKRPRRGAPARRPPSPRARAERGSRALNPEVALLAAIAILAGLVRLPHLGWGLPIVEEEALPMKKAFAMWGWSTGRADWNPHTAGWPSLSFYVHFLVQHVHYLLGWLSGVFHDPGDFFVAHWIDPGPLVRISRGISLVAASITALIGARVTLRLAGRTAALVVGGLLALAPLLVEYGQLVTPDVLAALFAILAVERIVWIAMRDHRADDVWAGVWIGLGISSKYTPVLLIPGLLATYLMRLGRHAWRSPRPWVALASAAAAFMLTSPFLLLDLRTLVRDVAGQALHLTAGHFGTDAGGPSLGGYVDVLGPGLGWGGFVIAVAGLVWGSLRAGSSWRALVLSVGPYYLALALLRTQFPRYVLPLLAPLAIGVGGSVRAIQSATLSPRVKTTSVVLVAFIALIPAAIGTARYHQLQAKRSTQWLADQFVRDAQSERPLLVAAEVLSLSLPTRRALALASEGAMLSPAQRERMMSQPAYDIDYLPMYTVQPEKATRYYDIRHFTAHDLVVVTDAVRSRYLRDTVRFATQARFYRDLERYAAPVARFSAGPRARGPEVRVYRMPPEAGSRLEAERGPLELPAWNASAVHGPDDLEFLEGIARAAYARSRWAMAARYYTAMLQAGEAGWMPEVERLPLVRLLGLLEERAGAHEQALRLYESYLARVPGDSTVRAARDRLRGSDAPRQPSAVR